MDDLMKRLRLVEPLVIASGVTPALKRSEGSHGISTSMPVAIAIRSFATLRMIWN